MKTVTIEVDPESAKEFLASTESKIAELRRARAEMDATLSRFEASAKRLREQLNNVNGRSGRPVRGANRETIINYLRLIPAGTTLTTIARATGIGISSAAYTLKNNSDFTYDSVRNAWKLK